MFAKAKKFIDQVSSEMRKVTWATKKEVMSSTIIVMIVVAIVSLFFMLADSLIYKSVQFILKIGS